MLHSMRETTGMNKRAIGIWWRESPGMLVALIFYVITGAVLPYAGIYFSAQIITELAGAKNPVVLRNLVLLLLGIESLLGLIYHYFKNRYTVERNRMLEKLRYILSEKMLSLDFEKVDDAVIQDKVLQIEQINRWSRFGLCMVVFTLERMLQAIAGIAGALILTVSSGKSGEKRVSVDEQPSFCDCISCWNTGIYDFGIENCGTGTEHDCRAFRACNFWKSCLEFHGRYGRRTGTGAGYPCL